MKARSSEIGYPPGWQIMSEHGWKLSTERYTGFESAASVNRFAARYRAAKLYKSSGFDGMSGDLAEGYCGFTQIMFSYAAFDFLLHSVRVKQAACHSLLVSPHIDSWAQEIRDIDPEYKLHKHCLTYVNEANKQHIRKFIEGKQFNYTYLASSIRHSFAHGFLTPNGGGCDAGEVGAICQSISSHLMEIMGDVFYGKMCEMEIA